MGGVASNSAIIKFMEYDGYKVDFLLIEKFADYDLKQFDYIVFDGERISSSVVIDYKKIVDNYYLEGKKIKFKNQLFTCYLGDFRKKNTLFLKKDIKDDLYYVSMCQVPLQYLAIQGFYKIGEIIYGFDAKKNPDSPEMDKILIYKRFD